MIKIGFHFRSVLLFFSLSIFSADACLIPAFGPEFDKHVVVETVDQSMLTFRVITPPTIEDRDVESAWLAYYEKPFIGFDQPRLPVHYDKLKLKRKGEQLVGEIKLTKLQPHLFATVRIRLGGLCGATAEALVTPKQAPTQSDDE